MADYSARTYDRFMSPLERLGLGQWRQQLLQQIEPPVLEIGVGTGASLRWYKGQGPYVAIDRGAAMAQAAQRQALALGQTTAIGQMDVQSLAFPDGAFASVLTSLVFCSVEDPLRGLNQIRRVLRPGGRLYMLEHVRPDHPVLGWLADVFNAPWHLVSQECHLNRRTAASVAAAGLSLESVERKFFGVVNLILAHK